MYLSLFPGPAMSRMSVKRSTRVAADEEMTEASFVVRMTGDWEGAAVAG